MSGNLHYYLVRGPIVCVIPQLYRPLAESTIDTLSKAPTIYARAEDSEEFARHERRAGLPNNSALYIAGGGVGAVNGLSGGGADGGVGDVRLGICGGSVSLPCAASSRLML